MNFVSLVGCIQDLQVVAFGMNPLQGSFFGVEASCSETVDKIVAFQGQGYLQLRTQSPKKDFNMGFSFKTKATEGILFYAVPIPSVSLLAFTSTYILCSNFYCYVTLLNLDVGYFEDLLSELLLLLQELKDEAPSNKEADFNMNSMAVTPKTLICQTAILCSDVFLFNSGKLTKKQMFSLYQYVRVNWSQGSSLALAKCFQSYPLKHTMTTNSIMLSCCASDESKKKKQLNDCNRKSGMIHIHVLICYFIMTQDRNIS